MVDMTIVTFPMTSLPNSILLTQKLKFTSADRGPTCLIHTLEKPEAEAALTLRSCVSQQGPCPAGHLLM